MQYLWWNFQTKEFDIRKSINIKSDDEAEKYIPHTDFAQSIYHKLRKNGKCIREAMLEVLKLYSDRKVKV